jgi:site-specific DNA-cytosine methylase
MIWFVKSKRAQSKEDNESWTRGGVTPTLNAFDMGDTRATVVICYPIDDGREMEKKQNGTGIGEEGAPSYTLDRAQHASVVVPPSVVRRLTPTECERLQGFPDGWTEGQTDGHCYKQMGNAVAVPVVEWIMERLVACDEMV